MLGCKTTVLTGPAEEKPDDRTASFPYITCDKFFCYVYCVHFLQ